MQHYVALIHGARGAWGVSFPDFPGCIGGGDSIEQAVSDAVQALHFHIEGMIEDGEAISPPSAVETIRQNPALADELADAVVMLVPVLTPAGRPVRLNISLDEGLVAEIDRGAKRSGQTRSGFLASAARQALHVAVPKGRRGVASVLAASAKGTSGAARPPTVGNATKRDARSART